MEQKLKRIPYYGALVLLAYMPFHVFLSQSLSLVTGGLDAWKIAKDVFAAALVVLTVLLVWFKRKSNRDFNVFVLLALAYMCLHLILWAVHPDLYRRSALLSVIYDDRLLWYVLIGFGAGLLLRNRLDYRWVLKLVLIVSTIVCVLGIIQYFLPKDILAHLGYSLPRGVRPMFFIDNKPNLPRIMSTIRDPNSLGAYLIVPITVLVYYLLAGAKKRRPLLAGLLVLHLLALFLTFSRSAWLGVIVSVVFLAVWRFRRSFTTYVGRHWRLGAVAVIVFAGLVVAFWHQYAVHNIIIHSDKSTKLPSSDTKHFNYALDASKDIAKRPLGHGPGTAGLVSIQNPAGGILPENYYLVIGYDLGIIGLALFVAINTWLYIKLYHRQNPLVYCLLASFWGYVVTNMLLQIWGNEAVAAQWWLLAGLCLAVPVAALRPAAKTMPHAPK